MKAGKASTAATALMATKGAMKDHRLDSEDKRVAQRFPVGWPVKVIGLDATGIRFDETSHAKDLSSTGVFVSLTRQIPVGSELQVLIKVPLGDERWMSYPGRVVRAGFEHAEETEPGVQAGQSPSSRQSEQGVAIKFLTAKPDFVLKN